MEVDGGLNYVDCVSESNRFKRARLMKDRLMKDRLMKDRLMKAVHSYCKFRVKRLGIFPSFVTSKTARKDYGFGANEKKDEIGSVESGLVLIPTMIFFLALIQIVTMGSFQLVDKASLHSLLIKQEIEGKYLAEFEDGFPRSKVNFESHYIPGVGDLQIARSQRTIPTFLLGWVGQDVGSDSKSQLVTRNFAVAFD